MNRFNSLRLLLCFWLIGSAFTNQARSQELARYIDVTGTADVKVAPDEVIIQLGLETTHKNIRDAIKQNDERLKKLIAVLEKQGIDPKHIQPGLIRVTPNYEESQQHYGKGGKFQVQQMQIPVPQAANANAPNAAPYGADPFGGQAAESVEPKIKDYTASKTVVVYSKDLPKLELVLVGIYESGVANVGSIVFQSSAVKKLRETLRPKAIQAAKDKAELLTAAIGQKIGKAVRIEESNSGGSAYPRAADPFDLPSPASYRYVPSDTSAGPAGIAPELITVSASVTVWFELP